jgi:hypothetical protein
MTLQIRVSGFLACTKILSALIWSQNTGMKALMRARLSSAFAEKIASISAGRVGGFLEAVIVNYFGYETV